MTDEELSELAECLEDGCQAWLRQGKKIVPGWSPRSDCRCPLGTLLLPRGTMPMPHEVSRLLRIPEPDVRSFMCGFDGADADPGFFDAAYNLGRLFREKYVTGGGK